MKFETCRGNYEMLGVADRGDIITFSVENAKQKPCSLKLYPKEKGVPQCIPMEEDPLGSAVFSVGVRNLDPGAYDYTFVIGGTELPDPYAKKIIGRECWADTERREDNIKCGLYFEEFNWKQDVLPHIEKENIVMYKLHVRGFSMAIPRASREKGTVSAIERKIPYLKELGITTLELMPVYEFEEVFALDKSQKEAFPPKKLNYWGYTRGNYFAPKAAYLGESEGPGRLKRMIYKLHQNGMECILEFYFENKLNPGYIIEVLRYWAREYHVDGFHLLCDKRAAELAGSDVYLSGRKLFYESFSEEICEKGAHGMELFTYNEAFAYSVRKNLNRQDGSIGEFLGQMRRQHEQQGFVNFASNQNGFTLCDLFSYTEKQNEENLEENQDGSDWNYSSNCGQEGPSKRREVNELRLRQMKNALAAVFLAQGVPLIWMGDENANSQKGNNNAYCQDNEVGWKSWPSTKRSRELHQFVRQISALRRKYPILRNPSPMRLSDYKRLGYPDLSYHGERGWQLDFDGSSPCVGMMYNGRYINNEKKLNENYIYVGYNFSQLPQDLALPVLPLDLRWQIVMDTGEKEPFAEKMLKRGKARTFSIKEQSVCLLVSKAGGKPDE